MRIIVISRHAIVTRRTSWASKKRYVSGLMNFTGKKPVKYTISNELNTIVRNKCANSSFADEYRYMFENSKC